MADNSPFLEDRQKLMTVLSLCIFLLASLTIICILFPFTRESLCFEKLEDFCGISVFFPLCMSLAICTFLYKIQAVPFALPPQLYLGCGLGDTVQREMWGILGEFGFFRTAGQSSLLTTYCTMLVKEIYSIRLSRNLQ